MAINFGINGNISVQASRVSGVDSSTPIGIVGSASVGTVGVSFFANSELAYEYYKTSTGTLKNGLWAIMNQNVNCPIIVSNAGGSPTQEQTLSAITALRTSEAVTSYRPDIIIAPELSGVIEVAKALESLAERLWSTAIVDVLEETESEAVAFATNFGSRFVCLVSPQSVRVSGVDCFASAVYAGMIAKMDSSNPFGWSESVSNLVALGVSSTTRIVDYADGQDSEARRLRNKGVNSIVKDVGWRTYGFESTDIDIIWQPLNRVRTFYKMLRTMMNSAKWARDRKADELLLVKQSVEDFMRNLKGGSVVLGFEAFFDPIKNTKATITNGQFFLTVLLQDVSTIRELNIELTYVDTYGDVLLNIING